MSGMMCGIDDAIEWIRTKTLKAEDMPDRIVRRLEYIRAKDEGVKPKYNKGKHIRDWWTCGNCGRIISDVGPNYCSNCGYRIKWDSIRCLTGVKTKDGKKRNGN